MADAVHYLVQTQLSLLPYTFLWGGCTPLGGCKCAPHLSYADL